MFFSIILIPLVTIIGTWYAAAWLRNGWWLWLIVPALPVGTILAIILFAKIFLPEPDTGLILAAEAIGIHVGLLLGLPVATIVAAWTRFRMRRAKAVY
jgi:drug/metabolite transporter superfamily protein YnfA